MKKFLLALAISGLFFSISVTATATATSATAAKAASATKATTSVTAAPIQTNSTRSILDNVVMIISPGEDAETIVTGTGFFISPYGHILTNEHVIHGGKLFKLCYRSPDADGVICYNSDRLKLLAQDSYLDLALLQLPQIPNAYNNNYLILGDSNSSKVGDEINVLGYPDSDLISLSLTKGLIIESFPDFILTDAQLFFGNSGSPALNNKNKVIGIAVAKVGDDSDSIGVIIPSNIIKDWLISIRFNTQNATNQLVKPKKSSSFVSKQGGFSINFPGKPMFFSLNESTEFGKVTTNNYVYKKSESEILLVAYGNLTLEQLKKLNSPEYLEKDGEKDSVEDFLGTITIEEFKLNKYMNYQGIFYKGKTSEGYFMIAQIYIVKNKFYQIAAMKKDSYPDDDEIKSFIGSFKLLQS